MQKTGCCARIEWAYVGGPNNWVRWGPAPWDEGMAHLLAA